MNAVSPAPSQALSPGARRQELIAAFERASGKAVAFDIAPRRPGDVAALWADPARAMELLGWTANRGVAAMCEDTWRWQQQNPDGYTG